MADEVGYTQDNLYLGLTTPLGENKLILRSLRGAERLSGLFRFELELISEDGEVDFSKLVGQTITVAIQLGDGESVRYIDGLVTEFSRHGWDPRFFRYRAVMRPKFWLATRKADCRIFQDMSVTDIIEKLLGEVGVTDYKLSTTSQYAARDYCVQYNETVFDFLSRLMEEEGIFYFFDHADGMHTLVLGDDIDVHEKCAGLHNATYRPPHPGGVEEEDVVFELNYAERVVTDKFAAEDFNFETPSTELLTQAEGKGSGSDMEVYEYPGGYREKDAGDTFSDIRLQEFEAQMKELSGASSIKAFVAGGLFPLIWYEESALNADYLIAELFIDADVERYRNHFVALPKDLRYRPARRAPKPRIHGTQTAIVTGKSGEEIWTDKFGRIKVQFHWDREGALDENTSCWIRVAQGWAGKNWGSWFLPRIGMEVVVSFLDGDPDRPLVTGCVYNGDMPQPYTLPDDQTKATIKSNSSKGGGGDNELRFEDKAGEEEIYLHAQKDWNTVVENDRSTELVEGSDTLTVKQGDRTLKVETGDETHEIKGKRVLKVDGAQDHTTGDGVTHTVTNDYILKVDGNVVIDATGDVTIKAGKNLTLESGLDTTQKAGQNLNQKAGMNMENKAEMNMTHDAGMNLDLKSGMNTTNKAGMALKEEGGMQVEIKGGMTLKAEGGMQTEIKGGMQYKAEGGMTAENKGGLTGTFEGGLTGQFKGGVMAQLQGAISKVG